MRVRTVTKGVHTDIITDIDPVQHHTAWMTRVPSARLGTEWSMNLIKPKTLRLEGLQNPHEAREVIPPLFMNLPILHVVVCVH